MRLLPEWLGTHSESSARQNSEPDRHRDAQRLREPRLPLRQPHGDFRGRAPRGCGLSDLRKRARSHGFQSDYSQRFREGKRRAGNRFQSRQFNRPAALTRGGCANFGCHTFPRAARLMAQAHKDGTIRVFTGKPEIGMGVETAFKQIVAEELDVAPEHVEIIMADTALTTNQGGVGGSTSIMMGAKPLRNAAANARYLLTQLAANRLGVAADQLEVTNGIVSVQGERGKERLLRRSRRRMGI